MPATTKGVWKLQEVRELVLNNEWQYVPAVEIWNWGGMVRGSNTNPDNNLSSPVQISGTSWSKIHGGECKQLALKTDGTLWSWGINVCGVLGDGTVIPRSSPVQVPGTAWCDLGGFRQSFAIKTNGTLWSWGYGGQGTLGDNTGGAGRSVSSPVQVPGNSWTEVVSGDVSGVALARKTDGTLWSWGYGINGQLGNNTRSKVSSPVQIPGTTWNDISAGCLGMFARKTDGTLWAWGCNYNGQLGQNNTTHRSSPTQIPGTSWSDISGGSCHTIATKTDGTLWIWGKNSDGRLGQNDLVHRSSPVQIPGTSWSGIASGVDHSLARKTDCTLWGWGFNGGGSLADNSSVPRSSPVQIPGSWTCVVTGDRHVLASKTL